MSLNEDEVLLAVIRKAEANGYEEPHCPCTKGCYECCGHTWDEVTDDNLHFAVLFSHSFAKAFWGEKLTCLNLYAKEPPFADEMVYLPAFAFHLQKMVLEENPLKYLEKFL